MLITGNIFFPITSFEVLTGIAVWVRCFVNIYEKLLRSLYKMGTLRNGVCVGPDLREVFILPRWLVICKIL